MSCKLTIDCESIDYNCLCAMNPLFKLLGSKWTPELITIFGYHNTLRYKEIDDHLSNISPTVLSNRLNKLVSEGYLNKSKYDESPPRVNYSFTDKGLQLWDKFRSLLEIDDID